MKCASFMTAWPAARALGMRIVQSSCWQGPKSWDPGIRLCCRSRQERESSGAARGLPDAMALDWRRRWWWRRKGGQWQLQFC